MNLLNVGQHFLWDRQECQTKVAWMKSVACIALLMKLILSIFTYGTNDVLTWEADIRKIDVQGELALYRDGAIPVWHQKQYSVQQFNHPPFVLHTLRAGNLIAHATGIPFRVWLRILDSLADVGTLWLVWKILKVEGIHVQPRLLFLVAISPISILVSGFHGNTDPTMMLFVILTVYLIVSKRPLWIAGAAFGMAMNLKIVPIIFFPTILAYFGSIRQRLQFTLAAITLFFIGSLPYLAQDPALVIWKVFGYEPVSSSWGLSMLASSFAETTTIYRLIGKPVVLIAVLLMSLWVQRCAPKASLFRRCGLVAFVFLFLAPGFGPQYLCWIVPWCIAFPWKDTRLSYVMTGTYLAVFYTVFSNGTWYLAANITNGPAIRNGVVILGILQILCWLSIGRIVFPFFRHLRTKRATENEVPPQENSIDWELA